MDSASKDKQLCNEIKDRCVWFLRSEQFCDCSFLVGTAPDVETIPSYKLILAITSPVFESMLFGRLAHGNHPIPIPDMHPDDFKALLDYIYSSRVVLRSFDQATGMYYGAKKYMLSNLQLECSKYFLSKLDTTSACHVFECAQLFDEAELAEEATKIFTHSTKQVLSDPSFEKIQLNTMIYIFSLEKLNIDSEMDLLEAAARYIEAQCKDTGADDNSKLPIRTAIQKIRFLTLTPKQFTESKATSSLLSVSEIRGILLNITSSNAEDLYPSGFSKSRMHRLQDVEAHKFSFTIQDVRNVQGMVCSPPFYIRDLPWNIVVIPEQYPYRDESQGKMVEVQLMCNRQSKSTNWSCKTTFELKICSQNSDVQSICSKFSHDFTKTKWNFGIPNFAVWNDILDPTKGFLKDGAITIDAYVSAEPPKDV